MAAVRTFYLIRQVSNLVRTVLERGLAEFDVTPAQYTLMNWLVDRDAVTSAMLARALHVSPQTMNTLISALHKRGLVSRQSDATNKRIVLIALTPKGRETMQACSRAVDELEDDYFAQLGATELVGFRHTLEGLLTRRARRAP
jgi:DNA-binding MarR family transcriptional regulator